MFRILKNSSGQATTEYILLLSIVVAAFVAVVGAIQRLGLREQMMKPVTETYATTYQYGDPDVVGFDQDGGPEQHPRHEFGNNFRIFINPRK